MSTTELAWFKSSYSGTEGDNCVEVAHSWRKSSYSGTQGDSCVEVAESWRKSSHSSGDGDSCVEIATLPATVHIRDSKDKDGPILTLHPRAWSDFLGLATHR